nr:hypothetical protein CFP56_64241 [Quercus suber]
MEEVEEKNKFELEGPSEKYEPANSGEETLMEKESMEFKKEGFVIEKSFRKAETNPYGGLTKLERLLREKALKKPTLKLVDKSKKGVKGEKLMGSAMKGQIYFRGKRRNKLHEIKSDEIGESSVKFIDYEREPRRELEEFGSKKKMNNPMDRYLNRIYTYEGDSDSDLPEIFKELIEFVEGKNTKLVMQKRLSYDDLSMSCYNSFSIQVEESFLTREEKEALNYGEEIEVVFIEPIITVSHVTLRKHPGTTFRWGTNWNKLVIEDELRAETTYLLVLQWNRVASENDLRVGTQVQLWSFRIHEKLCFVLVKVARDDDWLDIDAI